MKRKKITRNKKNRTSPNLKKKKSYKFIPLQVVQLSSLKVLAYGASLDNKENSPLSKKS